MHARFRVPALWLTFLASCCFAPAALAQSEISISAEGTYESDVNERILDQMPMLVSGAFRATPIGEVVEQLRLSTGLPFVLDYKALEDASIDRDTPLTGEYANVPLGVALRQVLKPLDLTWTVIDGTLSVTTPDKAANQLVSRIYPVRDLAVIPVAYNGRRFGPQFQQLMEVITATVAPTSWDEVGGPGAVQVFYPSQSLVISQTIEVHEQVAGLLGALRKSFSMQGGSQRMISPRLRSPRRAPQSEPTEEPRYAITPTAPWSAPRVHE